MFKMNKSIIKFLKKEKLLTSEYRLLKLMAN